MSGERTDWRARSLRVLSWGASIAYRTAAAWRNRKYDRDPTRIHHASVPVISIGNITAGGTGKTPMVAWIAKVLRDKGVRVSVISRGYRANESGRNDEAMELEQRLPDVPHLQNPDRVDAAQVAVDELETELIVLDDGFQHRRLHRDLDIVLIDATVPFGYGHVLPRGLLRESLDGLERADVVVLTRANAIDPEMKDEIRETVLSFNPAVTWAEAIHAPTRLLVSGAEDQSLDYLLDKNVVAICAIGNPQPFFKTVSDCGAVVSDTMIFPDHHEFSRSDVEAISKHCSNCGDIDLIVCTHKDLVKLNVNRLAGLPLFAISVDMQFVSGEQDVLLRIDETANPHRHD